MGAGRGSWLLLMFCCVVYFYGIGVKLWYWKSRNDYAKVGHFLVGCFLKLLIVLWMFYILLLTSRVGFFSVCVVIGYVFGLCGEILCGEFKGRFV